MRTKTQPNESPAESVDSIRAELETAEGRLAAIDPHRGTVDSVLELRRPLQEKISILRERLALAEQRAAEAEYARIETEIAELMEDSAQIENELQIAREQAERDLREHLNPDWLAGTGRFASCPPAIHGLLGFCNCVSELHARRDAVQAAIRSRENRIAERRAQRDRERRAAEVEGRKNLIAGWTVEIPLTPWKIIPSPGFTSDIMDNLERRAIPSALPDPRQPEIHALLPPDSKPHNWADGFQIESAEPMPPAELCPALAAVWQRATPSKKSGAKANR